MTHDLARAHGPAVLTAAMRSAPEDFRVEELDAFDASGEGEHLLLTIEKRAMNTAFVAQRIARWAGVPDIGVSYAGLKDRHAVTRQRFSVHLPKRQAPDVALLASPELQVIDARWHARKLPRGALGGNRFVLLLRDVVGERSAIDARLDAIGVRGVPNYFGEQRFGRDGDNVEAALAMFAGRRVRREQRSMLLSAARSELFNRVLSERVRADSWDRALEGEVWLLDGSRSVFGPESWNEQLAARLAAFDIHPTGPLWGAGPLRTVAEARVLEERVLAEAPGPALCAGLEAAGLRQERRATRLRPTALTWSWPEAGTLRLGFDLPPGAYATVVLAELGDVLDRSSERQSGHGRLWDAGV